MHIAFIITDLEPGGAEKCLAELLLRLDRKQYSPTVYVLQRRPPQERSSLVTRLEAAQVPLIFMNADNLLAMPRILWQLRDNLKKTGPQVVQTFLYHANILGTLASRWAGIQRIFVGIRVAEPSRWRRALENQIYPTANGVVFVSSDVQSAYAASRFQNKSAVITNGIEVKLYHDIPPADLTSIGLAANTPMLLFAGRLHPQKGLSVLLTHVPRLLMRHPHTLCIAGDGPEKQRLQVQVTAMGWQHRILFLGWRRDIPALLKRADALLFPSQYEGMPNILLEAMAAQTPLIAMRAEGVAELLGEATTRCTAALGDMESFLDSVDWILAHPEQRKEIVQKLYQRAIHHFHYDQMVDSYQQIWRSSDREAMH